MREQPANVACVGREGELAQLLEWHREAKDGAGAALAVLVGPAGIGKSRLLSALRSKVRLSGGVVLEGRCESGVAFAPFATVAAQALRFLDEVGQPWSARAPDGALRHGAQDAGLGCAGGCHGLWFHHKGAQGNAPLEGGAAGQPPHPGSELSRRRERFFEGMAGLLRAVSAVRTPIVMLHDLEHADHGTLDLVRYLLDTGAPLSFDVQSPFSALFVSCVRSDARGAVPGRVGPLLEHDAARRLALGALGEAGVRALLSSPEAIQRILARTGGSPEAIRRWIDAAPPSRDQHLLSMLSAAPELVRRAVSALSVLGRPASFELLERALGQALDGEARRACSLLDLLDVQWSGPTGTLAFTAEADQRALYEALDVVERKELHVQWLHALAASGAEAEERARHALKAGDIDAAAQLACEAAHGLSMRHAPHEAAELLESVLAEAPSVPDRLRRELVSLYRAVGDYRRGLVHARALRDAHPHDALVHRTVGDLYAQSGQLEASIEALREAHGLAHSDLERCEVEALLADVTFRRGEQDVGETWAVQAIALSADTEGAARSLIGARNTLGKLLLARGLNEEAAAMFEANQQAARDAGLVELESQALANLGFARLDRARPLDAVSYFEGALALAEQISDTRRRAVATEALAVCAHLGRRYSKAREHYQGALALMRRLSAPSMVAGAATNLGELYLSLGDVARASSMCELATQVAGSRLTPTLRAESMLLRGRVALARGDSVQARAVLEVARELVETHAQARVLDVALALAEVDLEEGAIEAARSRLGALADPEQASALARVALMAATLERAAGRGDGLVAVERAVRAVERCGDDELRVPAYTLQARTLADLGRARAAREALDRAFAAERRLSSGVPEDLLGAWGERRVRVELERVTRLVGDAADSGSRHSELPDHVAGAQPARWAAPRVKKSAVAEDQLQRWRERYPRLVGRSAKLCDAFKLIDRAARSGLQVLIRGESGTGKELVAEALHLGSDRADKPFVRMNCAAIVETLLLSELFGHERGAFTGAQARRKGRFEVAHGGTLFLDEIGDISPRTQAALLRVLQEGEFERVGGTQTVKVDVRIIAATHRDLEGMVRAGTFREDLYYRLRGVTIEMPALRERRDDLALLAEHLLGRIAEERKSEALAVSPHALAALEAHDWPGNVRELDNVLRSASLFAEEGVIDLDSLRPLLPAGVIVTGRGPYSASAVDDDALPVENEPDLGADEGSGRISSLDIDPVDPVYDRIRGGQTSLFEMKKQLERECIERALRETEGNITRAATLLGMKRPRLSQLVKEYHLGALEKSS
jgi:transcriptional regulator with GAF, ATPase, and Fis domain/tetratricopeptide (TPR) repeat protein